MATNGYPPTSNRRPTMTNKGRDDGSPPKQPTHAPGRAPYLPIEMSPSTFPRTTPPPGYTGFNRNPSNRWSLKRYFDPFWSLSPTARWYIFASVAITLFCLLPVVFMFLEKGVSAAKTRVVLANTVAKEQRRIREIEKVMAEAKKYERAENFNKCACAYKFSCLRKMLFPRKNKEQLGKVFQDAMLREVYEQGATSVCLFLVYTATAAVSVCLPAMLGQPITEVAA